METVDLTAAPWQADPRRPGGDCGNPECARRDRWVCGTLGGYLSPEYLALTREAREMAGRDGEHRYLDMAMQIDEEWDATKGQHLAAVIELAAAERDRQASRRADTAAAAVLKRSAEIELAVSRLLSDPHLADLPDFSAGPDLAANEVASELRIAMGLTDRTPSRYQAGMPPVSDLGRALGLRS